MSKYDWSNVPERINWITTDSDGDVCGFADKPYPYDDYMWYGLNPVYLKIKHASCYWKNSLEERPK